MFECSFGVCAIATAAGKTAEQAVKLSDGFNPYPHGKGAVLQLSKDLGVQLAAENIRVNAVCPGFIKTGLTAGLQANDFLNDTLSKRESNAQHATERRSLCRASHSPNCFDVTLRAVPVFVHLRAYLL